MGKVTFVSIAQRLSGSHTYAVKPAQIRAAENTPRLSFAAIVQKKFFLEVARGAWPVGTNDRARANHGSARCLIQAKNGHRFELPVLHEITTHVRHVKLGAVLC